MGFLIKLNIFDVAQKPCHLVFYHEDGPNPARLFPRVRVRNLLQLVLNWVVRRDKLKAECAL